MTRSQIRLAVALPILLFWGVMMGLLFGRELGMPRLEPTTSSRRILTPTDTWLGLFTPDRRRVGTIHLEQVPEERHAFAGVTSRLGARMDLELFGKTTHLDLAGEAWRPHQGSRAEFEFDVRSGGHEFHLEGQLLGGEIRGQIQTGGETLPLRLPIDETVVFASGVGSFLSLPHLEVGDEIRVDSFDPLTLRASPVRVRCVGQETLEVGDETVEARVLSLISGVFRSRAWVGPRGEILRAETPLGLMLEAIPPEGDLGQAPAAGADDLLDLTAIHPRGKRPFRGARRMALLLMGVESLDLPTDRVQTRIAAGHYRLQASPIPSPSANPPASPAIAAFLAADAFVQSDHPAIRRQAAAIVGGEMDGWERARRIHDWVFAEIDKEPVLSLPSALEVLEARRGDCNEHTVLFTALARASGLPTRIAIGLVWSEDYDGFYYHAWPEVHLGDWIWMDPTLGQPIADATHVKLLNGGIEAWPQLLPYLGRLEIEVREVE